MSDSKKLEVMNSVLVKMEDLKNSQESLIGKIGQIEVQLFEINSPDLDKDLSRVIDRASETLTIIQDAKNNFEEKRDSLAKGA
jgi:hypothetical protein